MEILAIIVILMIAKALISIKRKNVSSQKKSRYLDNDEYDYGHNVDYTDRGNE